MAWRRYLIATRMSNGLAAYPSREEDAWARLLEDLAEVDSSGLSCRVDGRGSGAVRCLGERMEAADLSQPLPSR